MSDNFERSGQMDHAKALKQAKGGNSRVKVEAGRKTGTESQAEGFERRHRECSSLSIKTKPRVRQGKGSCLCLGSCARCEVNRLPAAALIEEGYTGRLREQLKGTAGMQDSPDMT